MQRFILQRLLQSLITLFAISLLVFLLARLTGSPVDVMLDANASQADRDRVTRELGLDKPLYVQYAVFIAHLARGDLGMSIRSRQPVTALLAERLPNSLELVVLATLLALVIAIPLGILAGIHKDSPWDIGARLVATLGQAVPSFWAATVLILLFAVQWRLLPAGRKGGPETFVLPAMTMAFFGFMLAGSVRLLRISMLEVMDSEFIKFARIKGLSRRSVILKHGLRNALIPLVTFIGFYFGILLGGSVVIEAVFSWPGLGRLAYEAVSSRDYPVIQGVVLCVSGIILLSNLIVDVLYAYLDPRIRYE